LPEWRAATSLLDRGGSVRNNHRFGTGQRFQVTVRQGYEAAVQAEFRGLARSDRQFGFAGAFRHDQRARLVVVIDDGSGMNALGSRKQNRRRCYVLPHNDSGVATASIWRRAPCPLQSIYKTSKLNRN